MTETAYPVIRLLPRTDARAIRHGSPWVYDNEIVTDRRTRALANRCRHPCNRTTGLQFSPTNIPHYRRGEVCPKLSTKKLYTRCSTKRSKITRLSKKT